MELVDTTATTGPDNMLSTEHLPPLLRPQATHSQPLATTLLQPDTKSRPPATTAMSSPATLLDHQATSPRVLLATRTTRPQLLAMERLRQAPEASTCQLSLCRS